MEGASISSIYLWMLSKGSDIYDQQERGRGKLFTDNALLEEHQHQGVVNHQGYYIGHYEGVAHVTCGVSKYQTERGLVDIPVRCHLM
jgi:hypothetical protein